MLRFFAIVVNRLLLSSLHDFMLLWISLTVLMMVMMTRQGEERIMIMEQEGDPEVWPG